MSSPQAARPATAPCPACGTDQGYSPMRRPPLELLFCAHCGTLRSVRLEEPGLGRTMSLAETPAVVVPPQQQGLPIAQPSPAPTSTVPPAMSMPDLSVGPSSSQPRLATPAPDSQLPYPQVLIADPSEEFRNAARDALLINGIAEDVITAKDGGQVVAEFTRACRNNAAPRVVVLDVGLPLLDGKNVGILLRGVEDAFRLPPVELVYYTARPKDAGFDRILSYLKNARHVARDDSAAVAAKVQTLVAQLKGAS